MIWSRLSLSGKLFVAVVLPVLFAVLLLAGAVAFSMRAGFSRYLLDTELSQFDTLVTTLEQHPEASAGWPSLSDFDAWVYLLEDMVPRRARPPGAGPGSGPSPVSGPAFGAGGPPPERHAGGQGPVPLPDRLSLLGLDGRLIAGGVITGTTHADRPLRNADNTVIGTLRLTHVGANPEPSDNAFLARQFRVIGLTALVALLCASMVAWLTAQQFLAPIRRIGDHVARLASGDLSSRLNATRRDELGRMMRDHDALAESLESSRQRERQWVSDTSHELKTPLAVLRAQIEAQQDGIRPTTPKILNSMHDAVMRLTRLTEDLSLISRSDEGRLQLAPVPVVLSALTRAAAHDQRPRMREAGLRLKVTEAEATPLTVQGDPVRLRQVLDNLLDNACRYTDAPGRITVACHRVGDRAEITVSDTTPCPPAETLPELFDRFRRGETSRARSHGGSGLGLAICRALIEAHGGTITATPSDLGGLCIRVQLPLSQD